MLSLSLAGSALTCLDLTGTALADTGVVALAAALPRTAITTLDVAGTDFGEVGALALAAALPRTAIRLLNLEVKNGRTFTYIFDPE